MSPNRGRQLVRQAAPRRNARPSLERPSLFAGMEAGDSIIPDDDDAPRGGILSTLESVRQRKPAATRRKRPGWQSPALLTLMGAGVAALMGSFIVVVMQGHTGQTEQALASAAATALAQAQAASAAKAAAHTLPSDITPAAGVHVATTAAAADKAARIEDAPAAPPHAPSDAASQPVTAGATPPLPAPATAPSAPQQAAPAVATAKPAPSRAKASAKEAPVAKRETRKQQDADVALLEAMFHRTRNQAAHKEATEGTVGEQLNRQCGSLSGAESATCRARICVNNPGAKACHAEP